MYAINQILRLFSRNRRITNYGVLAFLAVVFILFNFRVVYGPTGSSKVDVIDSIIDKDTQHHNTVYNDHDSIVETEVVDNNHTIFKSGVHKTYLQDLFTELVSVQPGFESLPSEYPKAPSMAPWDDHPLLSSRYLGESYLKVSPSQVKELKAKHAEFLAKVKDTTSKIYFPRNSEDEGGFYMANSCGIVYVGGGQYSWFALLSIKHLRNLGSKLPVEVYIPFENEYEEEFCEKTLPSLNAKCVKMYEILDIDVINDSNFKIKGFMLKSLALLLSNFENILLLDADNVPYLNPDILFVTEPYTSHKFIVWPDYWERTTHPSFYDIQGIDLAELNLNKTNPTTGKKYTTKKQLENDVPLHDLIGTIPNPSTESGQLMISKKEHADVLLLSLYYNIYGPNYYYHLLTQWAPGQGDKDTFLAAANLLKSKYCQIKTSVTAIGYHHVNSDEFRGTAQGQFSPIDEYNFNLYTERLNEMYIEDFCVQKGIMREELKQSKLYQDELEKYIKINDKQYKLFTKETDEKKALKDYYANVFDLKIKLMFVHESTPKFDPIDLIINNQMKEEGQRIKFYDNVITEPGYYKFEEMQWQNIYDFLCSPDKSKHVHMNFIEKQIKNFGDRFEQASFCRQIQEAIEWIDSR